MTEKIITVFPDTSLVEAAQILAENKFDGVPVIDPDGKLVGILTQYDLVSKSLAIHLPTFQTILENLSVLKKNKAQFQQEFGEITSLRVKDVMNTDPLILSEEATFEEVVAAFRDHHRVNPIPVINKENRVVGVVSRFDVLKPLSLLKN